MVELVLIRAEKHNILHMLNDVGIEVQKCIETRKHLCSKAEGDREIMACKNKNMCKTKM